MISCRSDFFNHINPKPHKKETVVRIEDLKKGVDEGHKVLYMPGHAKGDWYHPDCELGRISSWNRTYVFVNFGKGDTNPACDPADLIWALDYP